MHQVKDLFFLALDLYADLLSAQYGQFIGDLPTDKGKFWSWLLGLTLGIGLGGYALAYLLFGMGVL